MSETVIRVENISKAYRLGQIGQGTLREDLSRWWATLCRKPDPFLKVGEEHKARKVGEQFWALDNVSFDVKKGEVLGIIGRNGAGKSTLLKILSQVTSPTSGEIKIKGRIASLLEVGTGFHPELTGRENIFLNGAILGMTKAEIRGAFDDIVAFSGVEEFVDTPVKRYSSGMYVRLAFAVAAHLEPEILVVDEVLAVGDAAFQKKCLGKMRDVSKSGRTIIFVSHNMLAVTALCGNVVWLDGGKIVEHSEARSLIDKYNARNLQPDSNNLLPLDQKPRTGSGAAKFARMAMCAMRTQNLDSNSIVKGDSLEVNLEIVSKSSVRAANVAFILYDSSAYRIIDINTALKGDFLTLEPNERACVAFVLHDILLKPGRYTVELWLGHGGVDDIDYVQEAGSIEVLEDVNDVRHTESFPGTYQCRFTHKITK